MNRRDFLTAVLGTTAAALIMGEPEVSQAEWLVPVDPPTILLGLERSCRLFVERFIVERERFGWPVLTWQYDPLATQLGDITPVGGDPVTLKHHLSVMFKATEERAFAKTHEWLEPAAYSLAERSVRDGIDVFGRLDMPSHCDGYRYGPIRMLHSYDIGWDMRIVRFDLLGGSSPAALRQVRKDLQVRLKDRIKRRRMLPERQRQYG